MKRDAHVHAHPVPHTRRLHPRDRRRLHLQPLAGILRALRHVGGQLAHLHGVLRVQHHPVGAHLPIVPTSYPLFLVGPPGIPFPPIWHAVVSGCARDRPEPRIECRELYAVLKFGYS
eukprot:1178074-Prorocentrum_minimum.AAC.4